MVTSTGTGPGVLDALTSKLLNVNVAGPELDGSVT